MLADISHREDIELLVDRFYAVVQNDAVLAPFFADIDFEHHKPRMVHFWSFVLLDEPGYTTNIFDKHMHMPLTAAAMNRWVELFETTAHSLYEGEKTKQAILRAKTIAWTFSEKMKLT
jgi:hemoglobin